jgi:hypothetical protein
MAENGARLVHEPTPLLSSLYHGATISAMQTIMRPLRYFKSWSFYLYPPDFALPNIVKTYECRPRLPLQYVPDITSRARGGTPETWRSGFAANDRFVLQHLLSEIVRPDFR